jgi:regulator of replication initiation timing
VLSDIYGCGPLVTLRGFDEMRSCNFGIRLLREPHSVDWYRSQIAAYDAAEAARVSSRVRQDAGLDDAVDHLLEIYERAIVDGKNLPFRPATDIETTCRAAARHLASIADRFKQTSRLEQAVQSLAAELSTARNVNERLVEECGDLRLRLADRHELERALESLSAELATSRSANERLVEEGERVRNLVADYQGLSVIRLRDAIVNVPVLGGMARRTARWLDRSPGR